MLLDLRKLQLIHKYKFFGVIHVGAHHGQERKIYDDLEIPKSNRYYFEPLARNFKVLTENAYPEENYFNFALGAENKKVNMFVEDNNQSQSSSILKPKLHLDQYPHIIFDQTEEVCMKRIDDLGIDFLSNLIVLDIQGYELEFFKGANRLLNQIDFILSEINREELYENCAQVDELDEYLKKFGFSRVFTDWAGGNWGDAFYMRKTRAL